MSRASHRSSLLYKALCQQEEVWCKLVVGNEKTMKIGYLVKFGTIPKRSAKVGRCD